MPTVSAPTLSTILCQRAGRSLRDGLWGGERLRRPAARALARIAAAALLLVAATLLTGVQAAPVNRLAGSDDPYLRSHAHDPVDWYPWGREALDKARRENKPIFLSIGYSSCWWCYVAQRDLFSNPQIAALMNRWFVNILVDREQRPDINQIYMLARQIMTGQSGWPNQVFLTPSLEPFYIGSYFPPKTTPQAQGFPTLLRTLHRNWVEHRPEVERIAGDIARAMRAAQPQGPPPPLAPAAWANAAQQQALARFDPLDGGFPAPGSAQQFPQPPLLGFLLARGANGHVRAGDAAVFTLQAMLEGGITDQLTGGVRRYSTDPGWSLPHFERMLSDNAQLLALYARAAQARHDPLLRWQAQRLARVLTRDFALPGGGFATAFDAASGGREGGSDLWTRQQIERVLGPQAARRWFALYELTPLQAGDRAGVLRLRRDVAEKLAQQGRLLAELQALGPQRRALLAARDRRPQPKRDDKLVVADNALAIAALSAASMTLDDAALLAAAQRAAERIWQQAWNAATHTLSHQLWRGKPGNPGDLADYGEYIRACLALWATSHDTKWRERAVAVAQAMLAQFAAPDGALRAAPPGDDLPPFPVPPQGDGPRPAAQTAAIAALLDLATIDPDTQRATRWAAAARAALAPLQALVAARPVDWPQLLQVISRPGSEKALGLRAAAVSSPSGAASAGGGAALLAPTPPVRSAAGAAARPAECDGLPVGGCSADVVQVRLRWAGPAQPGGRRPLEVQIDIAPGFHVNAHPASQPGLIATTLLLAGRPLPGVRYPAAQLLRAPFAPKGLAVWSGQVTLRAEVPQPAPPLALQVQACNDTACLVPVNLPLPLPPG